MPANLALQFLFSTIMRGKDDDERLDLRVRLGMPGALEERSERRKALFASLGVEVR